MNESFKFKYKVKFVTFRNEDSKFTILQASKVELPENVERKVCSSNLVVKGVFLEVEDGDYFESTGKWVEDKKYGWQISIDSAIPIVPSNIAGIKRFLIKKISSVGVKTADLLVNEYGSDTLDKIKEGPENISKIKGIGKKKANVIYEEMLKHESIEKLTLFLFKNGVSNFNDVILIYDKLGAAAIPMIQSNPYNICDNSSVSKFKIADNIARSTGLTAQNVERIKSAIIYAIYVNIYSEGNLYVEEKDIYPLTTNFVKRYGSFSSIIDNSNIEKAISELKNEKKIILETDENKNTCIYTPHFNYIENFIVDSVFSILKNDREDKDVHSKNLKLFVKAFNSENGVTLDAKQISAIENAAKNRISILSGGPGTGKTFTTNAIIKYFKFCNPDATFLLAAPTGRAAKRLTELTGMNAQTIHRLCGLQKDSLSTNSLNDIEDLDGDYLFIDEFSMVDANLFAKVLKAVINTDIRIVLIGDYHQLPSVGPGLILRDLTESNTIPTVILTELFRQSKESQIALNSQKILSGLTTYDDNGPTFEKSKQDALFIRQSTTDGIVKKLIESVIYLSSNTFKADDIMILSSMRKGTLGVINLNHILQQTLNPPAPHKKEYSLGDITFREGDRVMQEVNNYDLNVFNGDIGKIKRILKVNNETFITVDYPSIEKPNEYNSVVYNIDNFDELTLAYAMTVHKSQGSEYPCVLMPSSITLSNMDRNLLYTAITRAKKMVVHIGTFEAFNGSINKNFAIKRHSRVKEKLQNK